jgi:hypothetical protein
MLAMARDGLFAPACAGLVAVALPILSLTLSAGVVYADEREAPIASTLAVQTALQQGREHLLRGNAQAAVYVLEGQLARINGSREYLTVLRDAYRAYVKELRLAGKDSDAEEYLGRLKILDPGAALDGTLARAGSSPPATPAPRTLATEPARTTPTARAKMDDDPFDPANAARRPGPNLLEQAEHAFIDRRFDAAARLFEQAYQGKVDLSTDNKEQWAYCKLHAVVRQLNQPSPGDPAYADLDREVRVAIGLAPRLDDYGKGLLRKIQERSAADPGKPEAAAPVAVRHLERQADGWAVAETANFRIYHTQSRELAEKVAQVAEVTRAAMHRKWLGEAGENWNPRCELYVHATGQDYSRATGVPTSSPGHSTIRSEGGRVLGRRMDLHCDDAGMLSAVLPHETTHVVIAGKFGDAPVPRWADEGMAVLTEPRDKIDRHLRNLPRYRQDQVLLGIRQLMQMNDYPEPRFIGPFYAQSVSLVDFLSREKGPQTFAAFLREGLRGGYEPALRRHYGIQDFNELEQRWHRFAFGDGATPGGVAQRNP